ncbi:DUF7873 family protein [Nonomuraea glycinis]
MTRSRCCRRTKWRSAEPEQKLQDAVKYAREEANTWAVSDQEVGERLFRYLLA